MYLRNSPQKRERAAGFDTLAELFANLVFSRKLQLLQTICIKFRVYLRDCNKKKTLYCVRHLSVQQLSKFWKHETADFSQNLPKTCDYIW